MRPLRMGTLGTVLVLLAIALSPGVASAAGGQDSRNAENTFTKWRTTETAVPPVIAHMAGIVGGDVGAGSYAGEIVSLSVTGTTKTIDAIYHFNGSIHAFTASVHVVQTGLVNGSTAVITGRVTDGWLKDNLVEGQYTQVTCEQAPGVFGTCFSGTLDVRRGTKPED